MSSHHLLRMLKVIAQEQATCTSYKTADHRDELEKSVGFARSFMINQFDCFFNEKNIIVLQMVSECLEQLHIYNLDCRVIFF